MRIVVAACCAAALLAGCGATEIDPPKPTPSADAAEDAARATITAFGEALGDGDEAAARALGVGQGAVQLAAAVANAADLGIELGEIRVIDVKRGERASIAGEGSTSDSRIVTVRLQYTMPPWDTQPLNIETGMLLHQTDDRMLVSEVGVQGRAPFWLVGPVEIARAGRVLVIGAPTPTGDFEYYSADYVLNLARKALADVDSALPHWQGRMVVEAPYAFEQLNRALAASPTDYAAIAGVTASVDGTLRRDSAAHIYLNPNVFTGLGELGQQVVMTHEAVHLATGHPFHDIPTWLAEGFSDQIALQANPVDLGKAAGQAFAKVNQQGPPQRLPTNADLNSTADDLGATYELAWLAVRYIAQRWGDADLFRFHEQVMDGVPVARAFGLVLRTTQEQFVTDWAADTKALAARHR